MQQPVKWTLRSWHVCSGQYPLKPSTNIGTTLVSLAPWTAVLALQSLISIAKLTNYLGFQYEINLYIKRWGWLMQVKFLSFFEYIFSDTLIILINVFNLCLTFITLSVTFNMKNYMCWVLHTPYTCAVHAYGFYRLSR